MVDWWCLLALVSQLQDVRAITPIGGNIDNFVPTDLPGPDFPAASATTSNLAWPSGQQPARLTAWPQVGFGTNNRTLLPCWKKTVLHDHASGWPGLCMSLLRSEMTLTEEGCRKLCWGDPRCPVWQFVNQTTPGQCWVGFGTDCAWRHGIKVAWGQTVVIQGAQRVMHGDVLVLKNLSGWKINNLWNMGKYHHGTEQIDIERCKAWCYSTISCEYWQYSAAGGCYVDAPMWTTENGQNLQTQVQYPLTTNGGAALNTPEAQSMIAGEYIRHYCPPEHVVPVKAPPIPLMATPKEAPGTTDSGGPWSQWWIWPLLGATILICGGLLAYLCVFRGQGQPKNSRNKRGFKGPSEVSEEVTWENTEEKPLMYPASETDSRPPSARMEPVADFSHMSQVQQGYADPRAPGYDQATPQSTPRLAAVARYRNMAPEPAAGYSAQSFAQLGNGALTPPPAALAYPAQGFAQPGNGALTPPQAAAAYPAQSFVQPGLGAVTPPHAQGYASVPQQPPPQEQIGTPQPGAPQGLQFSAAGTPLYAQEALMHSPPQAPQAVPIPQPGPMQSAQQGGRRIQRLY